MKRFPFGYLPFALVAAFANPAPVQAAPADSPSADATWTVSGNGALKDGVYSCADTGRTAAKTFELAPTKVPGGAFVISGDVILPHNTGIQFILDRDKEKAEPDQKVDPNSVPFNRMAKGVSVRGSTTRGDGSEVDQPMPFKVSVVGGQADISLGPIREFREVGDEKLNPLMVVKGVGAEVSNLKIESLKANGYVPVLDFPGKTNVTLEEIGLPTDLFEAGIFENAHVPFMVADARAADISKSMSGAQEPFRNKKGYYADTELGKNGRLAFKVPGDQYSAVHVLAFSAGRPDHAQRMTVRMGYYGASSGILEDVVVDVPLLTGKGESGRVVDRIPVKLAGGKEGVIYHLKIPLAQTANVREFKILDLEFTRDMNTHVIPPDPNEFGKIAAGKPSDVVVLGATLEPSPVTMTYTTAEAGNVFHDTQKAEFNLTLTNRSGKPREVRAFANVNGPGTGEEYGIERKERKVEQFVTLAPGETKSVKLDVTPGMRGWFACAVGIEVGGEVVQQRDTTFAILAPDTRKAGEESPFGTWQFWSAHFATTTPDQIDRLAEMMKKGGWRHTYGGTPSLQRGQVPGIDSVYENLRKQYHLNFTIQNLPKSYQRDEGWWDAKEFETVVKPAIAEGLRRSDGYFKVLHESRSSSELIRRFSPYFGGEPYQMPEAEKKKLDTQVENVRHYTAALKAANPKAKVVLINDYPAFVDQYLLRKFPSENFDVIGLEGAMFLRSPERQPDWLSLLGLMRETRLSMEKYGYKDKPIWTTEALYHPTESGALSLYEQATIAVREAVIALQLGIERMAAAGTISDPSDDYHWTNWGSGGYCFRDPEFNPKPAYPAYAWLTQALDQAKPNGKIKTPNYSLHVADFKKPDGSHVYVVWTANGVQKVTFDAEAGGRAKIYDMYGNVVKTGDPLTVDASTAPVYIEGVVLRSVTSAQPVEIADNHTGELLLDFDNPDQLIKLDGKNEVLEKAWDTPNLKGDLESEFVEIDGATALKVSLKDDNDPRKLIPRYKEFALKEPIVLPGRPHELVFRVKGNSGWGRIMFELVDANGRVWTSVGNQYDGASNAADPQGQSFVNFEGWHTMRFPLVGMYPGNDQSLAWPRNYNWWAWPAPEIDLLPQQKADAEKAFEAAKQKYALDKKEFEEAFAAYEESIKQEEAGNPGEDGRKARRLAKPKAPVAPKLRRVAYTGAVPVDYPLTLKKIIVAMRPHILYLDEEVPVKEQVVYIDKLGVTQPPEGM